MQMGTKFCQTITLVAGKHNRSNFYSKREGYLQHTIHFYIALESWYYVEVHFTITFILSLSLWLAGFWQSLWWGKLGHQGAICWLKKELSMVHLIFFLGIKLFCLSTLKNVVWMSWNFVRFHKKKINFYLDKQKSFIPKKNIKCTMYHG